MNKILVISIGVAILSSCGRTEPGSQTGKPNVIFVLADDMRYSSLGITGEPVTQTPNLDQLAGEGVFFDRAFITSPICGPSRANIFTGQWERTNQIGFNFISHNVISEETFALSWLMQLKDAGYSTAFIGKHHSTIADREDSPLRENMDFCYYKKGHLGFYLDRHREFSNLKHPTQVEGIFEATEAFLLPGKERAYFFENADSAWAGCLRKRDPDKPFCAWINFNLPHAASIGRMGQRETDREMYKSLYADRMDEIPLPEGYPLEVRLPEEVFTHEDLMPYYKVDNKSALLNKKMKMSRAVHAIDDFVGRLRELLADIGEDENTIILFCSDNGLMLGEHGLGGKSLLYEEDVHVPLLVYSPFLDTKLRGKVNSGLVVGQDIPASILDMCGQEVPATYQGKSFLSLMENEKADWRQDIFLENLFTDQNYPRHEAVRSQEWKYIRYYSKERDRKLYLPHGIDGEEPVHEELFNLKNDPQEGNNLAGHAEYNGILEEYRNRCSALAEHYGK